MSKHEVELPKINLRAVRERIRVLKESYTFSSTYEYAGTMLVLNGRTLRLTRGAFNYLRKANF